MACIYKITNLVNNKFYIGLTSKTLDVRFNGHCNNKNSKVNKNCLLHKALRKYGIDNFKKEVLIEGDFNKKLLGELEKHYIRLYNSYIGTNKLGYNLTTGGEGTSNKIITDEIRKNMSNAQKGRINTEESKIKASISMMGRKPSKETLIKMSIAQKGRIITEEAKTKISNTLMGHSYNKGIPKSEEHKLKLKEANLKLIKEGYRIPFCKYVYQYDLNKNLIKIFNTVTEASKELKMTKNKILDYSRGIKTHSNYIFIITKEVLHA